ncbi:putative syntaxin-131 [Brachypodium distachyon]|uniref:Syntaxin N-terminal domain-containing protein n=1 Tax=Brachypodium distachyon TaxID=15368 RepID=A0A2K2DL01_BRADI|nr:putative syntaxin-131 [Brachypodium distachyon]PNT74956.1 hypothetical protein BRADI_1g25036v3 [Brachypodium distachyon]|eukprot:XP_024313688.1 putative syntaxin-131 [Brachypodium distachyon]
MSNLPAVASAVGERGIESGRLNTNAASDVQDLFQQIKEFEMLLDNTAVMVHRLKEANREFRSVTEASAVKAIKEHMERNMDEVWKMAHTMTDKLKKMILDSFENKNNAWSEIHGRVTMPMAPSSMTTLIALKNDLQNLRNTIREEYQEVVQIRIFAVSGTKLSDEVIRVIEVGSIVHLGECTSGNNRSREPLVK